MPAIGITGGISTGKTSFVRHLRSSLPDALFFDADEAARSLTEGDTEACAAIRAEFGPGVFNEKGKLNRAALRAIVFAAPARRQALEKILHPRIRARWSDEAEKYRHRSEFYFADIPLLYETGGEALCDWVVVVACAGERQLSRLMQRTGMSAMEAKEMIGAQMPLGEKLRRANHVVWNNGMPELLATQAGMLTKLWTAK